MALHERVTERTWLTDEQKRDYEDRVSLARETDRYWLDQIAIYHQSEEARQAWLNFWVRSGQGAGYPTDSTTYSR